MAFALQKGGVGKTSVAGNIAVLASDLGRKVLLIDGDPQASLSSWLITESPRHELADILAGKATLSETAVNIRALSVQENR